MPAKKSPRKQKPIPLRFLDGGVGEAVATGNNAAWMCRCARSLPLVGPSGDPKGVSKGTRLDCPDCGRKYFVVPEGPLAMTRAVCVEEVA